jgi:tetratricopeptide (TPR) repeat protein
MAKKLPKKVGDQIDSLSEEGNRLLDAGQHEAARAKFSEAYHLVPDPKEEWEATMWLTASIGDTLFQQGAFDVALEAFQDAVQLPGGLGNPFVHLRLGELQYEAGNMDRAADELARAYMAAGRDAFEQEDPKYFALVEKVLKPPNGHTRLP